MKSHIFLGPWFLVVAQLRVISPDSLRQELQSEGEVVPVSTSTFGCPEYGEALVGRLLYVEASGCAPDYRDALVSLYGESGAALDSIQGVSRESASTPISGSKLAAAGDIYLLRRGVCSFAQKVAAAQELGAAAAVIVDYGNSTWTRQDIQQAVVSDDGSFPNITIPSVLVSREDGAALLRHAADPPTVALEWDIPQRDVVRVDFWYSPDHTGSLHTLQTLAPAVAALRGTLDFHSHLYLADRDASHTYCFQGNPKLCATDANTLQEDLLQLCIRRLTTQPLPVADPADPADPAHPADPADPVADDPDFNNDQDFNDDQDPPPNGKDSLPGGSVVFYSEAYWNYLTAFADKCTPTPPDTLDSSCGRKLLKELDLPLADLNNCLTDRAQDVLLSQRENNAWGVTAARINGARFAGSTTDPTNLLKAACLALTSKQAECKQTI
ncbi:PA domain protein, partial [Gregarina niphandrodes]